MESIRKCTKCNEFMTEGYCIDSGFAYYCSDECLHTVYTPEEWEELYDDGEGDSYWTQWEDSADEVEAATLLLEAVNELLDAEAFMETLQEFEDEEGTERRERKCALAFKIQEFLESLTIPNHSDHDPFEDIRRRGWTPRKEG
jgi:hypothetical protein